MGKKSLIAAIVGATGGVIFGFALGFHSAVAYLIGVIPNLIRDLAGPQNARLGEFIGEGLAQELAKYTWESNLTVVLGYIIGVIVILKSLPEY
jgi:hypothetical protein